MTRPSDLPDYARPPIIEVVIGSQFTFPDGRGLHGGHIGMFWSTLRDQYPNAWDSAPVAHIVENFAGVVQGTFTTVEDKPPLRRTVLEHKEKNWLLQLQEDRFLHNWRRTSKEVQYPHFEKCYELFASGWEAFSKFCAGEKLAPKVDQLEVTYINHIPRGSGWEGLGDIGKVFPRLAAGSGTLEMLNVGMSIVSGTKDSRLHVIVRNAIRQQTFEPVLLCELTVRGLPSDPTPERIAEWFMCARQWIVREFDTFTSPAMHEYWGKK